MGRRIAIADIHGCIKTLDYLLNIYLKINKDDAIFFLGDYIDRGPDSKAVLDKLIELKEKFPKTIFLRGNHEELLLKAGNGKSDYLKWMYNGGGKTLQSLGLDPNAGIKVVQKIPKEYLEFIESTEYYHEDGQNLLVHAGINLEIPDFRDDKYSMLWIRHMEGNRDKIGHKRIIHGHTPLAYETAKENLKRSSTFHYSIDTGCVYKHPGMGFLSALDLDTMELIGIKRLDEV